jgi:hypothetical protein
VKAKSIVVVIFWAALLCAPILAAGAETSEPPLAGAQASQSSDQAAGEKTGQVPAAAAPGQTGQLPAPAAVAQESGPPAASSEQYKFEASEIEKKPYHIGGFAEVRPVLDGLNKGGALYRTNFYNQHEPGSLGEFNSRVQMDGSLEKGIARLFVRGNFSANDNVQGLSKMGTLYEGYLNLKPSDSWSFDAGQKTFKWGKGYAWNPAAFIDRPKDPTDPDLALEGYWAASGQYLKSFQGPLKTFSFQTVFLPVLYNVYDHTSLNSDFAGAQGSQANTSGTNPLATTDQYNVAARSYFLLYDTDIDLTFLAGQTKTPRYGIDFSRNIGTNLEVHGEASLIENFQRNWVDQNGAPHTSTYDAFNYLLGVRYLSTTLTTYILEWYRNGTGLSKEQMQDFFSFVNTGYNTYTSTGKSTQIVRASNLTSGNYGKNSPMQDYFYLRVSQDEPFGVLYWTPAISSVINLNDGSFQVIPELTCTRLTNWEFRFRTYMLVGGGDAEFGNKQNDYRLELRVRRFF